MAPVLQCPDCGTKHPLAKVQDQAAFPCDGCQRMLKVPTELRVPNRRATDATKAMPAAGSQAPTAAVPPVAPAPVPPAPAPPTPTTFEPPHPASTVPRSVRLLLWLIAVPLGFLLVFGFARAFGFFTSTQMQDVFLADMFWPVIRLLPFVALVTASIVHVSVLLLGRRRTRRATPSEVAPLPARTTPSRPREPARPA
jgi:hypothetical protein